jgi:hypothetical protein
MTAEKPACAAGAGGIGDKDDSEIGGLRSRVAAGTQETTGAMATNIASALLKTHCARIVCYRQQFEAGAAVKGLCPSPQ